MTSAQNVSWLCKAENTVGTEYKNVFTLLSVGEMTHTELDFCGHFRALQMGTDQRKHVQMRIMHSLNGVRTNIEKQN